MQYASRHGVNDISVCPSTQRTRTCSPVFLARLTLTHPIPHFHLHTSATFKQNNRKHSAICHNKAAEYRTDHDEDYEANEDEYADTVGSMPAMIASFSTRQLPLPVIHFGNDSYYRMPSRAHNCRLLKQKKQLQHRSIRRSGCHFRL
jgi:hypothetical protein